jgi:hypothetical protein
MVQALPMIGGGVAVLFDPKPWLVVVSDLRMSGTPLTGCSAVLPVPVQIGPNQYEGAAFQDFRGVPKTPLTRSALRVGVQTPGGEPLVGAMLGGGLRWSRRPAPFGTATIGVGTRGSHIRFYAELEGDVARVRAIERRAFYHADSGGGLVLDSRTTTPVVLHPMWPAAQIGVEFPLVSR